MPNALKKNLLKSKKTNPLLNKYEEDVSAIIEAVGASKRVLLGTHEHPDGDALGSTLALYHLLTKQGKEVVAYIPDEAAPLFAFLPNLDILTTTKPDVASFDTVILLDYTQLYRTHLEDEVKEHPNVLSIDHHHDNQSDVRVNLVVPEAAATAHILYELFEYAQWDIDKDIATCLLTGIFTDTGSFMHDSVTPNILEIASALMSKGARLAHIAHETYQKKDLSALRIWGVALSRILISEKTGAAVSIVTYKDLQECNASLDDMPGIVNMLNTLPNTKFAMLLVEFEPGKIKGSLRSEPQKGVDVSKIAKRLGGGGHVLASGFEVEGTFKQDGDTWRVIPNT